MDRYNFVIDRYNEESNKINDIKLSKIKAPKLIRKIYDLYTWLSRIILGIFLIIIYYFYQYRYRIKITNQNKAKMITYKKYLINDNQDYIHNEERITFVKFFLVVICFIISLYFLLLYFIVMIVPIIFFTIYLVYGYFIHFYNTKRVQNIFTNMIYESKLDDKGQLNDYILVNSNNIFQYSKFNYFPDLIKIYKYKGNQNIMIYGDLFICEYNIISRSLYLQIICMLILTILVYIVYIF